MIEVEYGKDPALEHYATAIWDKIRANEHLEVFHLPGRDAPSDNPAHNTCILGCVALTEKNLPPETAAIQDDFGLQVHAYLRLSRQVVLALAQEGEIVHADSEQHILLVKPSGIKYLDIHRPSEGQIEIARPWLMHRGVNAYGVSRRHVALGRIGTSLIIHDLGSTNHTRVAIEAGTSIGPLGPNDLEASLLLPNDLSILSHKASA